MKKQDVTNEKEIMVDKGDKGEKGKERTRGKRIAF